MIISFTVPEVWCVMDAIIFHFGLFFALLQPRIFCPNSPKNQNFKTMKKMPGDIIPLHKCTKNHDHMLYCSWDIARDRCNCYVLFWAIFCLFTPPSPPPPPKKKKKKEKQPKKWKFQKNEKRKKTPGDIILHKCTKNHGDILHCSWDMVRDRCNYFSFWAIFSPFTPLTA